MLFAARERRRYCDTKSRVRTVSTMATTSYFSQGALVVMAPFSICYSVTMRLYCYLAGGTPKPLRAPTMPKQISCGEVPSNEKTPLVVVTGSNTGIGFETARSLVLNYGCKVVLACRSRAKAEDAITRIEKDDPNAKGRAIFVHPLDLSDLKSVKDFCRHWVKEFGKGKLNILVNNAGRNTNEPTATVDGLDPLFQTNFVGHYVLTRELIRLDALSSACRVVNLSSVMHHFCSCGERLEDKQFWREVSSFGFHFFRVKYCLSKLAAVLFTIELNRRFGDRIQAIAANPGAV